MPHFICVVILYNMKQLCCLFLRPSVPFHQKQNVLVDTCSCKFFFILFCRWHNLLNPQLLIPCHIWSDITNCYLMTQFQLHTGRVMSHNTHAQMQTARSLATCDITRMYLEMWDWSNMQPGWLAPEEEKLKQRQCDNNKNNNFIFSLFYRIQDVCLIFALISLVLSFFSTYAFQVSTVVTCIISS